MMITQVFSLNSYIYKIDSHYYYDALNFKVSPITSKKEWDNERKIPCTYSLTKNDQDSGQIIIKKTTWLARSPTLQDV